MTTWQTVEQTVTWTSTAGTTWQVVRGSTGGGGGGAPSPHAASHENGGSDEVALDGSQITSGTVGTARLGTGAANATTFLRGDQTWAAVTPGASALNDLTDVDTATDPPATDDVLAWDGSLWTPAALTAADTGAIPASIIDAKGDLIVGTANDTAARLGVGSNGQVLTADSAQASGVKWAAAPYVWAMALPSSGYWVGVSGKTAAANDATTSLSAAGRMAYVPCALISGTYDRLGVLIGTGAASTLRLGLYSVGSNGKPDQLVLDAGTVSGATPGMAAATIAPTTLAGPYWAAVLVETYASGLLMYCYGTDEPAPFQAVAVVSANGRTQRAQTVSGVGSGGLPVSAPPVNLSGNFSSPMVIARVA